EVAAHTDLAAGVEDHRAAHRQGSRLVAADGEEAVVREAQVAGDRDRLQRISADDEPSPVKVHAGDHHARRRRALTQALEGTIQVAGDHDVAARTKIDRPNVHRAHATVDIDLRAWPERTKLER